MPTKGARDTPHELSEADMRVPYEPESDVGETVAWCDTCGDERRFVRTQRDAAQEETEADVPDVRRAMTGETGWRCTVCDTFVPNLIDQEGYDYEYSNVGYTKNQFKDEEKTVREAESGGVTPPQRSARAEGRTEAEKREGTRKPEE